MITPPPEFSNTNFVKKLGHAIILVTAWDMIRETCTTIVVRDTFSSIPRI